ncbi:MAG: VOC family protein [Thermomicrobiales bacterium]
MQPYQTLYYVEDLGKSQQFYASILGQEGTQLSPAFHVFGLDNGWALALLRRDGADPEATPAGGTELIFSCPDREKVDATAAQWRERGVRIALEPVDARFGYSFVALDPDGNRLRVGHFPQG